MAATLASLSFLIRSGVTAGGSGPLSHGDALSLGTSETRHGACSTSAWRSHSLEHASAHNLCIGTLGILHSCHDSAFDVLRAWLVDRANLDARRSWHSQADQATPPHLAATQRCRLMSGCQPEFLLLPPPAAPPRPDEGAAGAGGQGIADCSADVAVLLKGLP